MHSGSAFLESKIQYESADFIVLGMCRLRVFWGIYLTGLLILFHFVKRDCSSIKSLPDDCLDESWKVVGVYGEWWVLWILIYKSY